MYHPKSIESKWQKHWQDAQVFRTENPVTDADFQVPKHYTLDMFPYPSGAGLHVGHPKGFTANDIVARYKHAQGYRVLHPMGWDSFGLPAENYAIKTGVHPKVTTDENIATFKRQIQSLGMSYDWSREIATTDPEYYQWTQWIFLKLFEQGLAYEQDLPINYCPSCKTGLANEEVLSDHTCERCGATVEKRKIRQWVLAITKYAERLLSDVDRLDWPEGIKEMQRNWIGKSEGCEFSFQDALDAAHKLSVYTTRVDTVFGVTYVVVAPDHPDVGSWITSEYASECEAYVTSSKSKSDQDRTNEGKEKTGVFTGSLVVNPFNGEKVPVWIADYVLGSYGTGAVMAVPAHDERDFAFAEKYSLPIKKSILMESEKRQYDECMTESKDEETQWNRGFANCLIDCAMDVYVCGDKPTTEDGYVIDSECIESRSARTLFAERAEREEFGKRKINYRLRDWLFSRQRYWGEPIPLIHLDNEAVNSLPRISALSEALDPTLAYVLKTEPTGDDATGALCSKWKVRELVIGGKVVSKIYDGIYSKIICDYQLPLELPEVERYEPSGDGNSPLALVPSFVNMELASNLQGRRETNTMPQWAGSCWYYLRFMDPSNKEALVDPRLAAYWGEVDSYVGGAEHAVLHLLYARFWHKFLFDIGVVPTDEPFFRLRNQGLILGPDGNKMSKSKGNVVNPDTIVDEYGADTFRLYEMSMADFKDAAPWNTDAIIGVRRFLDKVWKNFAEEPKFAEDDMKAMKLLHKTIKKVGEDIDVYKFNTAISALMILVNGGLPEDSDMRKDWKEGFLLLLHPFAPHISEELWSLLGHNKSIYDAAWPEFHDFMIMDDEVTIAIQVNGKLRGTMMFLHGVAQEEVAARALEDPEIYKWIEWKEMVREIFVPNKLLSIVVK